jgi:hypothetical protein
MPMTDYEKMKTAELRKMVREHRKTSVTPLGKMSKVALMMELDKFAGTPSTMPSQAPVEKERPQVVKHAIAVQEGKHTTKKPTEKVVVGTGVQGVSQHASKKEVKSEAVQQNPVARSKLVKGSQEARDFMASIRMKKTKKDNVE